MEKEQIQKEAEKRYPLDYGKNGNAVKRAARCFNKQEIFKEGVEWAIEQVKNNCGLDDVSNCDYCDKEIDKLIDENGFNYCEDCYMR
jgi:hypothetical protein